MGKTKSKQRNSFPLPTIQHDAFISKNKKRKEKRLSQKFAAKQSETGDFIPVKKSALKPLQVNGLSNKNKQANLSGLSRNKKQGNTPLSTSLPIKGSKTEKSDKANNSIAIFAKKKVTGILSNPNTPKQRGKNEHVTFDFDKKDPKKFLDDEAEEGEEPINAKPIKPYEKKNNKSQVESSDESDDDGSVDAEDFMDMEASEGEETEDEDNDVDMSDSDDSNDSSDGNTFLSGFLNDDDEEGESGDDSEEDEDAEDDEPASKVNKLQDATPTQSKLKGKTPAKTSAKMIPAPLAKSGGKSVEVETPIGSSEDEAFESGDTDDEDEQNKSAEDTDDEDEPAPKTKFDKLRNAGPTPLKTKSKCAELKINSNTPTSVKPKIILAKTNAKTELASTPAKTNIQVTQQKQDKSQKVEADKKKVSFDKPSPFIGFIRRVPHNVTEKEIKSALTQKVAASDVLEIVLKKIRRASANNAFIYMKDNQSLSDIVHGKFDISGSTYIVYRARSSEPEVQPTASEPVAFLPRVPQWITDEELKNVVEKEVGIGNVTKLVEKRLIKNLQTRNILMYFADVDTLQKAILKGEFKIKDSTVIVREAVEGPQVTVYRAVFTNIPEKTNEATVKKAIEGSIGKNTVCGIRFSFRKQSYAFVVFKDEESMKKALALGDTISVKGEKLQVQPYKPRKPRKRAPLNEQAKAKLAEKRKRKSENAKDEKENKKTQQPSAKKRKVQTKLENGKPSSPVKQKKKPKSENGLSSVVSSPKSPVKQEKKPKSENGLSSVLSTPKSPVKQEKKPKTENSLSNVVSTPKSLNKQTKNQRRKSMVEAVGTSSPSVGKKISPLKDKIQSKKNTFKQQRQQNQKKKNKQSA